MNFTKLIRVLTVALPICVAVRILQIINTIEYTNGFYIVGKELLGNAALIFILLVCAVFAVLALLGDKKPIKKPKSNWITTVSSLIAAVAVFGELFGEVMPLTMPAWQVLALKTVTVFTVIYFIAFSLEGFTEFKLPSLLHVVPCIYATVKTICTFINISSLALISDNVLLVAAYCALMLFFVKRAKLYNRLEKEKGVSAIAATGTVSTILCVTLSLGSIIINLVSAIPYLHTDTSVMWGLIGLGQFIIVFLCELGIKKEDIKV